MRLYELIEAIDKYGVYGKPAPDSPSTNGSQSPLTGPGDHKWQQDKKNIYNWFKRPYLTNGPKGNYKLPVKKKKVK